MRVWLAVLLAACGSDPLTIPVSVPGQPVLFTAKLGTSGWKPIAGTYDTAANATTYPIEVTGDFELVAVCQRDSGTFVASNLYGTADDADVTLGAWEVPNCVVDVNGIPAAPNDQVVTITVTAPADTDIWVDYAKHSVVVGPSISFKTWPGIHDAIAYGNAQILIMHDLDLRTNPDLGAVPLAEQGAQIVAATYDLPAPEPGETEYAETRVRTRNGAWAYWTVPAASPTFAPTAVLGIGDEQSFTAGIQTDDGSSFRSVTATNFDPVPANLDLLPPLGPATAAPGAVSASWTPPTEPYTTVTVEGQDKSSIQSVTASKLWMDRHSPTQLAFDLAVDGYSSEWLLAAPSLRVEADRWTSDLLLRSGVTPTAAP